MSYTINVVRLKKVVIYSCIKVHYEFFGYQQILHITNFLSNSPV